MEQSRGLSKLCYAHLHQYLAELALLLKGDFDLRKSSDACSFIFGHGERRGRQSGECFVAVNCLL